MNIYTSYHAKAVILLEQGIQPISISVQFPRYSKIKYPTILNLAPTRQMLKMSNDEYNAHMINRLNDIDPKDVIKELKKHQRENGVALLCYEKDRNQCHRKMVAEWLTETTGIQIKEYEFSKTKTNQTSLY